MGLFDRKPAICTVCKKETKHKHKAKKEWYIDSPLCANCYMDKLRDEYDSNIKSKCVKCGVQKKITDLWEPRWQWDVKGLLCKTCFDSKEGDFKTKKEFCVICNKKMGFVRYNPKPEWKIEGQLCRNCWDEQKAKNS